MRLFEFKHSFNELGVNVMDSVVVDPFFKPQLDGLLQGVMSTLLIVPATDPEIKHIINYILQ